MEDINREIKEAAAFASWEVSWEQTNKAVDKPIPTPK